MKQLLQIVSYIGLACVILPPAVYLAGAIGKPVMSGWMLAGTVLWFATVSFWMDKKRDEA